MGASIRRVGEVRAKLGRWISLAVLVAGVDGRAVDVDHEVVRFRRAEERLRETTANAGGWSNITSHDKMKLEVSLCIEKSITRDGVCAGGSRCEGSE